MSKRSPAILMILLLVSLLALQGYGQVAQSEKQQGTLINEQSPGYSGGEEYENILKKNCKGVVMNLLEFLRESNVSADQGKCVSLTAAKFQLRSSTTGLFNILQSDDIVFVEFPAAFQGTLIKGIFQVKGEYTYETQMKTSYRVPHLLFLVGSP